jgi:hypothetical protein
MYNVTWCDENNNYFALTQYGRLGKVCCGDNFTTLGMRMIEIKKRLTKEDKENAMLLCYSGNGVTLGLSNNPKVTIEAMYANNTQEVPVTLVKVEGII